MTPEHTSSTRSVDESIEPASIEEALANTLEFLARTVVAVVAIIGAVCWIYTVSQAL